MWARKASVRGDRAAWRTGLRWRLGCLRLGLEVVIGDGGPDAFVDDVAEQAAVVLGVGGVHHRCRDDMRFVLMANIKISSSMGLTIVSGIKSYSPRTVRTSLQPHNHTGMRLHTKASKTKLAKPFKI